MMDGDATFNGDYSNRGSNPRVTEEHAAIPAAATLRTGSTRIAPSPKEKGYTSWLDVTVFLTPFLLH
jgi:hypothetical protein